SLNISNCDAAKAIAKLQRTFDVDCLDRAIVVRDGGITRGAGEIDAAEGIADPSRTGIANGDRAVAIIYFGGSVNSGGSDATKGVADIEGSVGGHSDVVGNRPGGMLAEMEQAPFVRIDGLDVDAR